jgi:DNA polymerase-4
MRKIIHIDMDCFYAAIEVRDRPELAEKPVAVGGTSGRGVLTTCNYLARKFGCHSAMPTFKAQELCPELIIIRPNFERYQKESRNIRKIFLNYTPLVEPLSLDEAFLDISILEAGGSEIALEIRKKILEDTNLTASAGIAPNKLLAKIASEWKKPDGQFEIEAEAVSAFMKPLLVKNIWGVGPKSVVKLNARGIENCGKLQGLSVLELERLFGKFGEELYHLCRGLDNRPVEPDRVRKSMSTERTFSVDLETLVQCEGELMKLYEELHNDLRSNASDRQIEKLFVKLKFTDFKRTTAECSVTKLDWDVFKELLDEAYGRSRLNVRLIGAGVRFKEKDDSRWSQLELELKE